MQSRKAKPMKKVCKCSCCFNQIIKFSSSLDHQNSSNIYNSSTFQYDFATATSSSLYPNTQFTNPESIPTLQESFRSFTRSFPQYLTTVEADEIRASEYRHLNVSSHVFLDYNGHALFSFSQYDHKNGEFLASSSNSFNNSINPIENSSCIEISHMGNNRSSSSSSSPSSEFEKKLKGRIMRYLNVLEDDYSMFFTANQTSSFGLLSELYPFESNKNLVMVYDHENESLESMKQSSQKNGGRVYSAEFKWPKLKIHCTKLEEILVESKKNKRKNKGLFIFPVQSRISGAKYSYQWMSLARENGWHILLDATTLNPKEMDTLGLSLLQPEFLICTFYNIFGQDPSGFSCLIIKKSINGLLNSSKKCSFNGLVSLNNPKKDGLCDKEVLKCKGLDQTDSLGLILIGNRIRCLINWLTNALLALYHPHSEKGVQLVQIYGPRVKFDRGSSLAFNIFDWKGEKMDPILVQKLADRNNISLGCGFLRHVWFSQRYQLEKEKVLVEDDGKKCKGKKRECLENGGISVVTATISFLTNFEDMYMLWKFVSKFLDADFVEKERWRYIALNQKSIEV
ncbi:unnamed protein product [Amaranthus hypochondriacus]